MADVTVHDVKAWLRSYGELRDSIQTQRERLEALRGRLESPKPATPTGMPRGGGDRRDWLGSELGHLQELEERLADDLVAARTLYREIDSTIAQIHGPEWPDRRAVLRMRYLDLCQWEEVCRMVFGRKLDFEYRQDSYLRRTFTIHRAALVDLMELYIELLRRSDNHETRRS